MTFLWIYFLYTIAVLVVCYRSENLRYKLFFGYLLGLIIGGILAFHTDLDIAAGIAIFSGFAATAKMSARN